MPTVNSVLATLVIRNSIADNWVLRNPVLAQGEFGLESDTFLMKIGDGVRDWEHLPYLNKLNARYFKQNADGTITFSDYFGQIIENLIAQSGGDAHLIISDDPTLPTDPISYSYLQRFVANAIAAAGHLTREIVQELPTENISDTTIYMIPNSGDTGYEEYMYIGNAWDKVGDTGDHSGYTLPVATAARLGGVKSAPIDNNGDVLTDDDYVEVDGTTGFMTLTQVSTSKLYVPTGDTLILYGGTA